jgi:hypothetical protein
MEAIMKLWTINELQHLTRAQLIELRNRILALLGEYEVGSEEHATALRSLENIRRTLAFCQLRNLQNPRP